MEYDSGHGETPKKNRLVPPYPPRTSFDRRRRVCFVAFICSAADRSAEDVLEPTSIGLAAAVDGASPMSAVTICPPWLGYTTSDMT